MLWFSKNDNSNLRVAKRSHGTWHFLIILNGDGSMRLSNIMWPPMKKWCMNIFHSRGLVCHSRSIFPNLLGSEWHELWLKTCVKLIPLYSPFLQPSNRWIFDVCGWAFAITIHLSYNLTTTNCWIRTRLNIVFSVTYSLELHNTKTIYCISSSFSQQRSNWLFWH